MNRQDMVKDFLKEFNSAEGKIELPAFLEDYRVLSCLYEREEKSCYMVAHWQTDEKYLLKIRKCKDNRNVLEVEHQRIQELAQAFPEDYRTSLYWKENGAEYLLKFYIQGMDLEAYQEKKGMLDAAEILRIAIEICRAAAKLHALTPPVVHRDIKPKNLIIDDRGNVHLIDFETARDYKENHTRDTVFFGTEGNAAPEQYGYSQSDVRTDVYGIGKVLEYLLHENPACQGKDRGACRRIHKIIQKAAAFDPANRYQSVPRLQRALEKALNRLGERRWKRTIFLIGAIEAVAAALLICAQLYVTAEFHRLSEYAQREGETPDIEAQDGQPLLSDTELGQAASVPEKAGEEGNPGFDGGLEQAISVLSGKEEMTEVDYERITRLVVLGNQVYGADADIEDLKWKLLDSDDKIYQIRGTISDLSALSKMKNLKQVALCGQNITDISPLAGLPIEELYLSDNRIEDFSVVETLGQLRVLSIEDNPVSVLPRLSQCRQLVALNINGNSYENLDFLADSTVGDLYLCDSYVENGDFSVLTGLHNLRALYSQNNQYIFYEQLPALTQIKRLIIWNYIGQDLSIVKSLPQLESLVVTGDSVRSLDGVEAAAGLTDLAIDYTAITDISRIKELPRLGYLKIKGNAIEDYTPLFECESLRTVSVNARQEEIIESIDSGHFFQITED